MNNTEHAQRGMWATYNGFFPQSVTTKSIKYAGRKWKKMTQRVCMSHELLMLPSGNHMASFSGLSCRCFRPVSRTYPHVMAFSSDCVTLQISGCFGLKTKAIYCYFRRNTDITIREYSFTTQKYIAVKRGLMRSFWSREWLQNMGTGDKPSWG